MIEYCSCRTVNGIWHSPQAKAKFARRCPADVHKPPVLVCDVCDLRGAVVLSGRQLSVVSPSFETPGFKEMTTGRRVPYYSPDDLATFAKPPFTTKEYEERAAMTKDEVYLVCADCESALRSAQQVALDNCLSLRAGLNQGKILTKSGVVLWT